MVGTLDISHLYHKVYDRLRIQPRNRRATHVLFSLHPRS